MAQGLLAEYFPRKSASPSTVSNVKHRILKISSQWLQVYLFIFFFV